MNIEHRTSNIEHRILDRFPGFGTCSIHNPREKCITFLKDPADREVLFGAPESLVVIAPRGLNLDDIGPFQVVEADEPEVVFTMIHNEIHYWRRNDYEYGVRFDHIDHGVWVDDDAVIGPEGLKIVVSKTGERILFFHTGNVTIREGARVGPGAVIHRACLDSTIIEKEAVVGALCNIGHNAVIGAGSILTAGVMIGGSARIGKRCFIGMGAVIGNGIRVCDDVRIGMGAVVTRDILTPGVWFGNPAKFQGEWDGRWD